MTKPVRIGLRQHLNAVAGARQRLDEIRIETVLDDATDLRLVLEGSSLAAAQHDRRRINQLRQLEKGRFSSQHRHLATAATHNDDPIAVNVHAIRIHCDSARHILEKLKQGVAYLSEFVVTLKSLAKDAMMAKSLQLSDAVRATTTMPHHSIIVSGSSSSVAKDYKPEENALLKQLQEALIDRDKRVVELQRCMMEAKEKQAAAESLGRQVQRDSELSNKTQEKLFERIAGLEVEVKSAREQGSLLEEQRHKQREENRQCALSMSSKHNQELHELKESQHKTSGDAKMYHDQEVTSLRNELLKCRREYEVLASQEEKWRSTLEESREKRLGLKRKKDELILELDEAKNVISVQAKEQHNAKELIEALVQELKKAKAVLQFEASQNEHRVVMGAGGGGGADSFSSWRTKKVGEQPAAVQRVVISSGRKKF